VLIDESEHYSLLRANQRDRADAFFKALIYGAMGPANSRVDPLGIPSHARIDYEIAFASAPHLFFLFALTESENRMPLDTWLAPSQIVRLDDRFIERDIQAFFTTLLRYHSAVYVHYSNIEVRRRHEIERSFTEADAAICFASSTLELGIDIGDIDVVILIGPPGSRDSLIQRIGRGNRRGNGMRVICFYRTPLERLLFAALLDDGQEPRLREQRTEDKEQRSNELRSSGDTRHATRNTQSDSPLHPFTPSAAHFRPAVAVQQIFSLLKQSRTAAVRLAELASLFAGMLSSGDLEAILGELQLRDYLKIGRPGEWRSGDRLNELFDQQSGARPGLSVYSNIQSADMRQIEIRDQHTQQTIARVDTLWLSREALTLEGQPVNVEWYDGEALWVATYHDRGAEAPYSSFYRSARQLLSYDLARLLPIQLGLPPDVAPLVGTPEGWYWFHWLGDLYGRAALDLLRYRLPAQESAQPGLCVRLTDEPQSPPAWTEEQVVRYLDDNYRRFESLLALGPFQTLLPLKLRRRAIVEQFDVQCFLRAVAALRPVVAPETQSEDLLALLSGNQQSKIEDGM
jgi:ATP-dependent Lhr-like helicase